MVGISFRAAGLVAVCAVVLYTTLLQPIGIRLGIGRTPQPVTDFPFQCRRVSHVGMEACEDIWLDETSRLLYLACSNVLGRQAWLPAVGHFNASARPMKDSLFVLDIDKPLDSSRNLRKITSPGFYGTLGEGSIHLLSVSGRKIPGTSKIELYLVNMKPSVSKSPQGQDVLADNSKTGANMTIELFELKSGSTVMKHIRTFTDPLIVSPNNVAPVPDGSGFYISNDHGLHKPGLKQKLSPYLSTGNVVYCTNPPRESVEPPACKVVATGMSFPNGLAIHPSDPTTLYVPSSAIGKGVWIYKIHPDGQLSKLSELEVPYPMDNLSPSADGAIYAAAFPKAMDTLKHFEDPASLAPDTPVEVRKSPASSVVRIDKVKNLVNDGKEVTWRWEKVIEDGKGQVLPASTVAIKDSKTGRLFISGVLSYFITVCDPV